MTAPEFMPALFGVPLAHCHTGGGLTALIGYLDSDGSHVLVTDADGEAYRGGRGWLVGFYDADGNQTASIADTDPDPFNPPYCPEFARVRALLDHDLAARRWNPLTVEQIECLTDPARTDESLDLLDDLEARCGISSHVRGEAAAYVVDISDSADC